MLGAATQYGLAHLILVPTKIKLFCNRIDIGFLTGSFKVILKSKARNDLLNYV